MLTPRVRPGLTVEFAVCTVAHVHCEELVHEIASSRSLGMPEERGRFREDRVHIPVSPWEEEFGWRVEQAFWSYFNRSEDPEGWNRRWVVEQDVPWDDIRREPLADDAATMIESFFAVESYLPDFAEKGLGYYRSMVGL